MTRLLKHQVQLVCTWLVLCFADDLVSHLPGLTNPIPFGYYSGYLDELPGRHMHYEFVESNGNNNDSLIVWLNGGPGCSSLYGFWSENGPFRVTTTGGDDDDNGQTVLLEDSNSWNSLANILYLESPVGVGFSYYSDNNTNNNNDSYVNSDNMTADSNYLALKSFYRKFPQYSNHSLYLTGERLAIGNGAFNNLLFLNSRVHFAYNHGLIDYEEWHDLESECCSCSDDDSGQVCTFHHNNNNSQCNVAYDIRLMLSRDDFDNIFDTNNSSRKIPVCFEQSFQTYLNRLDVREALHIPSHVKQWVQCQDVNYNRRLRYWDMSSAIRQLLASNKLQSFIIYNGDIDIVCDFMANQEFVELLGLNVTLDYQRWLINNNTTVAGYEKRYDGLTYMTVRGAGHLVPKDKPLAALEIIRRLISI
ncbi:lysosomal protective protein-like [Oppia nitens]|uniref:lysosomal protective protein-like n=1 Tax=Oppia nitens TaxID=1686743 RepID=UPI0023DC16BC|nr:lysosomal protective protein-like [Oppia nitens]